MVTRLRLTSGLQVLDHWAGTARQADKNVLYKALFAVADGSAFLAYDILDEGARAQQFLMLLRQDLVTRICLHRSDSFGIVYIGPFDGVAPEQL